MSFIIDKLAPTPRNKHFKMRFKPFFKTIPVQKTISEVLKK